MADFQRSHDLGHGLNIRAQDILYSKIANSLLYHTYIRCAFSSYYHSILILFLSLDINYFGYKYPKLPIEGS